MKNFLRDTFLVGISKTAVIFLGLGRTIIMARYLGPEGNGIIATLVVYPTLFMSIGSLGIRQSTTYFIGKSKFSEKDIKTSITQIWLISSLLSVCVCYFLIRYFSNSGNNFAWVILSIVPIPFSLFNTYNSGVFLGKNQIGQFTKIEWIQALFVFLFTFFLIVVFSKGISGALLAIIAGPLLMFIILLFKSGFIRSFKLQFNWIVIRSLLSLGITYAIALSVINLNYRIDIIFLDKLSSSYEVGIYSKGVAITEYLWHIPMLLSTVIFARSANAQDGIQFSKKVTQLLRISIMAIGIGSLILVLLANKIILLMYGKEFIESTEVLQFLMPGVLLLTIFKVLNMDLAGKGKPWIAMQAMIPALIVNIGFNIFFIPRYGANGAAISSTISYTLAAIIFLFLYSKTTKIKIVDIIRYRRADFMSLKLMFTNALHLFK